MELKKYQKDGVNKILDWKRLIVGDVPGLGKTAQAITAIERADAYPCLVICPSSLKINWEREVSLWTNKTGMTMNDSIKHTFPILYKAGLSHFFIVNYESLAKYFVYSMPKNKKAMKLKDVVFNRYKDVFRSVIIDESHRVKCVDAIQTKLTKGVCSGKEYIIELTGTPVLNNVLDLATQLSIIEQIHLFGGYENFVNTFTSPRDSDLANVNAMLKANCYYRREKSELPELPEKTRQKIIVEIDNQDEYDTAINDLAYYLREYKQKTDDEIKRSLRGEVMVKIGVLKQISARGKIVAIVDNIESMLAQGEKIVVFGHHKEILAEIKKKFPNISVSITGDEKGHQRQMSVDMFQNDETIRIAICSISAAGVGLTLTAGRITMFVEMGWHPAIMEQAEDRQHRLGQKKDVHCIYFLGNNTIDEWVYDIIERKREICDAVTGCTEDIEWNIVNSVIDLILKK